MHSIRAKITLLTIAIIIVCVLTIGLSASMRIHRTANQTSTQYMNELCNERVNEIEKLLHEIQQDVDISAHYLFDSFDIVELVSGGVVGARGTGDSLGTREWDSPRQQKLDEYLTRHVDQARTILHSAAYNTSNALTYFYRLNPELSRVEPGFLYARQGYSSFQEQTPTDILAYRSDDVGHVGWYYRALDRGRPSWLAPYKNDNLDAWVTTYVAPIYVAGTFVGVVGMDLSYGVLEARIKDLKIFRTGYAFLTDELGHIIYHPTESSGALLGQINSEWTDTQSHLKEDRASTELIEYTYNGEAKKAAWRELSNGMRLFVAAPVAEIEGSWRHLIWEILFIAMLLLAGFTTIATVIVHRITTPLNRLTAASEQISNGNYDVEIPKGGQDEIGVLSDSFRQLTEHLKIYISDLNSKAYKDALTHVKNKAAFELFTAQLDEQVTPETQYAVLVFDCNNLKPINDRFGHQAGDDYLRRSCDVICKSFVHSPVFRIGGDEFVVILQDEEYLQRNALLAQYRKRVDENNRAAKFEWEFVNLAMGLATCDAARDHRFAEVFRRADEAMYADKLHWKQYGHPNLNVNDFRGA